MECRHQNRKHAPVSAVPCHRSGAAHAQESRKRSPVELSSQTPQQRPGLFLARCARVNSHHRRTVQKPSQDAGRILDLASSLLSQDFAPGRKPCQPHALGFSEHASADNSVPAFSRMLAVAQSLRIDSQPATGRRRSCSSRRSCRNRSSRSVNRRSWWSWLSRTRRRRRL